MISFILWLLDRLKPLIRLAGADYGQLRAIVQVKLMMDNRRNSVTLGRYGKQTAESSNSFVRTLVVYVFIGGLISLGTLLMTPAEGLFMPLTLQFSYIMALCAMTLISDFSSVILDSSDNQIILPRPASSRTLWLARIVHITSYLMAITLSLSIVAVLMVVFRFGITAGLVFLLMSILSAVLMVFLTNVLYLGIMQFVSEEKLREVINYFQIVMAVLFYGGYQLLPRLLGSEFMMSQDFTHQAWYFLIPPMWMAGVVEMIVRSMADNTHLTYLFLALTVPIAGLWVMSRFLTANFTRKLSGIDQESRPEINPEQKPLARPRRTGLAERLSDWVTSNPLERAAFTFTWYVTSRDRKYKLKTYPQLGFGLAYLIFASMSAGRLSQGEHFYLFALYFSGLYIMIAQYQLSVSDNFKASWVYGSAPIGEPGNILSGSLKAIILKLLTPFYVLVAAFVLYRYGTDKIGDVLLAFSNSLVLLLCASLLSTRYMPFSIAQDAVRRSNTARSLSISLLLGAVGFAHYGLSLLPHGVWIALPFSLMLMIYLLRRYRQTNWTQIEMA